jgi:hypothetical protein
LAAGCLEREKAMPFHHFEEDRSHLAVGLALAALSGAVVGIVLGALLF